MKPRTQRHTNQNRFLKLITMLNPKSPISEAYRTLRTNIQFSSIDRNLHLLMFTSTGPGEGKTTTASNTAVVAAQSGKKVLLVDCDMRKPSVHHTFRLPNGSGLTNVLTGQRALESTIQATEVDNLHILTSGPIPPNPAELLGSQAMAQLIAEMKNTYDQIIFDTPPVIAVTDAQILSTQMDGVILVIHSGKTHRELAIKAKQQLENVHAKILGVVLNNKKIETGDTYYYYYGGTRS